MNVKKLLMSWQLWAIVGIVGLVLFIQGLNNTPLLLLLAFVLVCPITMMFMMAGHKHK